MQRLLLSVPAAPRAQLRLLVPAVRQLLLALSIIVPFSPLGTGRAQASEISLSRTRLVFVIDRSDSMSGSRIADTVAAAQLGVEILGGHCDIRIISFSDSATVSPTFDLRTQVRDARRWITGITATGGTRYVPALQAIPDDASAVLFLSDGRPSDSEAAILTALGGHRRCPVHTIGIETSPEAERLLGAIAAETSGGFYRVGDSSDVVEAFLSVLGQVRRFARHEFNAGTLELDAVQGELLAIGFDTMADFRSIGDASHYDADLPGSKVRLARIQLDNPSTIVVEQSPKAAGRVIVIRFDLPQPAMQLRRIRSSNGGQLIEAVTKFTDSSGRAVTPGLGIKASFELLDSNGNIVQTREAETNDAGGTLSALLPIPAAADDRLHVIRSVSVYPSSDAHFTASVSRAVDMHKLPVEPALRPGTTVNAYASHSGEPLECILEVSVDGRPDSLRSEFFSALKDRPPRVEIIRPDGSRSDSQANPELFESKVQIADDGRRFFYRLAYRGSDQPGMYRVIVPAGTAAGVAYPSGDAQVYCVDRGEIQIIGVTTRRKQRSVLFDSEQDLDRYALVGDPFWIELVRGTMDPRKFAGLASGLQARLIGADGAVTKVDLHFRDNRYVTDEVTLARPGNLQIEVDIAVEGLSLRFEAELRIGSLDLQITPLRPLLLDTTNRFPQGALVPFEVGVYGDVLESPAPWDDILEVTDREEIRLVWTLQDSAGTLVDGDTATSLQSWKSRIWLSDMGKHTFTFALVDGSGQHHETIRWELDVVKSPVQFDVLMEDSSGTLEPAQSDEAFVNWLPDWLTWSPRCVVTAYSAPSEFSTRYYLSGAHVNGADAPFDESTGRYLAPVRKSGPLELVGKLSPYRFGKASNEADEYQVQEIRQLALPQNARWGMLTVVVTAILAVSVISLRLAQTLVRHWRLSQMSRRGWEVVIYGPHTHSRRLVRSGQRCWTPRIQVCRPQDDPSSVVLVYPEDVPQNYEIIGAATQRLSGKVRFQALRDLPGLARNESRDLEQTGDTVVLDDCNTLTLEVAA